MNEGATEISYNSYFTAYLHFHNIGTVPQLQVDYMRNSNKLLELSMHRRAPLLLEGTQEKFRAREILKVLSTESYRADTVVLGWVLARTDGEYPSPFPPPHTILRKAQISHIANLHTSMVLSLINT